MKRRAAIAIAAAALALPAAASATTFISSDDREGVRYYSKPEKLRYVGNGVTTIRHIEWSGWGAERAVGAGDFRPCRGAADCAPVPVRLVAKKPQRSEASEFERARYYTKLRLRFPDNAVTIALALPE